MGKPKIPCGNEKLFKRDEWQPADTMLGEDKILTNPIFDTAFERVVEQHVPVHDICFMSLCTVSRPYSKSTKWKRFMEAFAGRVDFVVCSNGGLIPEDFWSSYPYMTYDGPATTDPELGAIYKRKQYERIKAFFTKHKYKYVLANFRPKLRNAEPSAQALAELLEEGCIEHYAVIPDNELYSAVQADIRPPGGKVNLGLSLYPDTHPLVMEQMEAFVRKFSGQEQFSLESFF